MPETTFNIEIWRRFLLIPLPIVTAVSIGSMAFRHWPLSTGIALYVFVSTLLILFLAVHTIWLLFVGGNFVKLSDNGLKYYSLLKFKPAFVNWGQIRSINPPNRFTGVVSFSYIGKDGAERTGKIAAGILGKENMASLLYLISEQTPQNGVQPA